MNALIWILVLHTIFHSSEDGIATATTVVIDGSYSERECYDAAEHAEAMGRLSVNETDVRRQWQVIANCHQAGERHLMRSLLRPAPGAR